MAYFTRTHGDSNPIVNFDKKDGGASNTNTPINPAGPKLDFFCIDFDTDSPVNQMGTGGAIEAVLRCVGQLATVHMYQVNDTTDANQMSLAIYPTGAWTSGDLQDAIEGLGTVNGYDLTDTLVYNNGFSLAV